MGILLIILFMTRLRLPFENPFHDFQKIASTLFGFVERATNPRLDMRRVGGLKEGEGEGEVRTAKGVRTDPEGGGLAFPALAPKVWGNLTIF